MKKMRSDLVVDALKAARFITGTPRTRVEIARHLEWDIETCHNNNATYQRIRRLILALEFAGMPIEVTVAEDNKTQMFMIQRRWWHGA